MRPRIPLLLGCFVGTWTAAACGVVLAARRGKLPPTALGKRPDGSFSPWRSLALGPALWPKWLKWRIRRWRQGSRDAHAEVRPGFWIGRRPLGGDLPPVRSVIDLAANYPEPRAVRENVQYRSVPMLQAHGLTPEQAARLARELARRREPVYLHCANGDKRTGVIAALTLIAAGEARTPSAALRALKRVRPSVGPNPDQLRLLREAAKVLSRR